MNNQTSIAILEQVGSLTNVSQSWSDEKKNEFCNLFKKRVRVSQFVLICVAREILNKALHSYMVGVRKNGELNKAISDLPELDDYSHSGHASGSWERVGDRDKSELMEIARTQAKQILQDLPKMADVVAVIDKTTSERMQQKEAILKECNQLRDELVEVVEPISMSSMVEDNPKITLKEFLGIIKKREERRDYLVSTIDRKVSDGIRLEKEIAKALYKGLPGLSEAVSKTILDLVEQVRLLDTTTRQVEEKVKFGDCEAALEILNHFGENEIQSRSEISERFKQALANLGLNSGKKNRRNGGGTRGKK